MEAQANSLCPTSGPQAIPLIFNMPAAGFNAPAPVVEVDRVSKVYEPSPPMMRLLLRSSIRSPVQALDRVSLSVGEGRILAVVGPNGAGKSTLFRILTGLTTPSAGSAWVGRIDATRQSAQVRRLVGFAPAEERTLLLRHTSRENLLFHGRMQGLPTKTLHGRVDETLDLVGLGDAKDRAGFALSTGMRSRLQLARAWLHRPKVLILDEPTGAVDPLSANEFLGIINALATEEGVAVLISSHRLEEIDALREEVLLLDRGRVIFSGNMDTLRQRWQPPGLEFHFSTPQLAKRVHLHFARIEAVKKAAVDGNRVKVETSASAGELMAALGTNLNGVEAVTPIRTPLVDVIARALADHQAG